MADQIKSSQVVAQVESDGTPVIKTSQTLAQAETALPPIVRAYQVVAQVEYVPHTASGQFMDGFECGHAWAWDRSGMTSGISGVKYDPYTGSGYARTNLDDNYNLYLDDGDYVSRSFMMVSDTIYTTLWYRPAQLTTDQWVCAWYSDSTLLAWMAVDSSTHELKLYRGSGTGTPFSVGTSKSYPLVLGERCKIYVAMEIAVGGCSAEVYADGIHVMATATASGYANVQNVFQLGGTGAVKASYDNIVIADVDLRTDANYHINRQKPSGAGSSTQWTPSVAPNYDRVNNIPFSSGAYAPNVHTNTAGYLDLYACEDLIDNKTYLWAQISAILEQEGSPTPGNIALVYKTGGSTTYGNAEPPDYGGCNVLFWTLADDGTDSYLDDLEIGIESRA